MPFFVHDGSWFEETSRVYVWVVLTVPVTVACFLFYWVRLKQVKHYEELRRQEDVELQQGEH